MRLVRAAFVLGGALLAGSVGALACSTFSATDSSDVDAALDGPPSSPDDAGTDASDASDDAADAADVSFSSPLKNVLNGAGAYSVEVTEVTNAQFRSFKLTYGPDSGAPWPECHGKTALGPTGSCGATTNDDDAVTCVDWCDANSYCQAIGRRLCERIGGGVSPNGGDISSDEWAHACGGEPGTAWPYGTTMMPTACLTMESKHASVGVPGSFPKCQGGPDSGVTGVFDMSGNAAEWSNACTDDGGTCVLHGGSYENPVNAARCDSVINAPTNNAFRDVGFRCCAAPTP